MSQHGSLGMASGSAGELKIADIMTADLGRNGPQQIVTLRSAGFYETGIWSELTRVPSKDDDLLDCPRVLLQLPQQTSVVVMAYSRGGEKYPAFCAC